MDINKEESEMTYIAGEVEAEVDCLVEERRT
jgi:hypothetical protein